MKTTRSLVDSQCVILTLAYLCLPFAALSAEKSERKGIYSTNAADQAACEQQLNRIHGAFQEYLRQNQKLPRWLSDLVPDFIHDPNILVCPFVLRTGNLKQWRAAYANYPVFGDPASCSYAYEFCMESFPYVQGWTQRDYKERQMHLMGLGVPIVRCFAHRPILNLAFDGSIYGSPREWEDNFVIAPKYKKPFHDFNTNSSQNAVVRNLIEPHKLGSDAPTVDLSAHYNALLLYLGQIDHSGKFLVTYPNGLQKIGDIEFDIRGLVHLTGKNFPINFPEAVRNIIVGRKCASIHFLHGTLFGVPAERKIASYVIRYADGRTDELPIVYGQDLKTCWFDPKQETEVHNPKIAWLTAVDRIRTTGKSLRLYQTTWKNQHWDAEVRSIDYVSHLTESAPFLVAITVE